jgi:RimJ/RimL family protein N-acetyltransferase
MLGIPFLEHIDTTCVRSRPAVYAIHLAAIRTFEKVGFVQEGLRKKQYQCNVEYVDHVMLGLLGPDS